MKSVHFDCEIFEEADGNTAIYTILHGLEFAFRYLTYKNT